MFFYHLDLETVQYVYIYISPWTNSVRDLT